MADVTEEDLEEKRQHLADLRAEIAEVEVESAAKVRDQSNAVEAAQLDAEAARLEAQLAAARETAKASSDQNTETGPLASVNRERELAEQGNITPVGVTVDPNAGDNDSDDKNEE